MTFEPDNAKSRQAPAGSPRRLNRSHHLAGGVRAGHVEGAATVAAYAHDDVPEKRRPLMQRWADAILGRARPERLRG